jgi:hypothetical protein
VLCWPQAAWWHELKLATLLSGHKHFDCFARTNGTQLRVVHVMERTEREYHQAARSTNRDFVLGTRSGLFPSNIAAAGIDPGKVVLASVSGQDESGRGRRCSI